MSSPPTGTAATPAVTPQQVLVAIKAFIQSQLQDYLHSFPLGLLLRRRNCSLVNMSEPP